MYYVWYDMYTYGLYINKIVVFLLFKFLFFFSVENICYLEEEEEENKYFQGQYYSSIRGMILQNLKLFFKCSISGGHENVLIFQRFFSIAKVMFLKKMS